MVFFVNGTGYATLTQEPYSVQMEEPDKGDYMIMAVVYDDTGKETQSESVNVEVGAIRIYQEEAFGWCGFAKGSGSIDSNHPDFTGTGFANTDNVTGVQIVWGARLMEGGDYRFTWRYACVETRPGNLYINDTLIGAVDFGNTGDWAVWDEISVEVPGLKAGITKVTLEASGNNGLANIDYLKLNNLDGTTPSSTASCSLLPTGIDSKANIGDPAGRFDLFPVPADRVLFVRFHDPAENIRNISVYSMEGKMVMNLDQPGSNQAMIDLEGLNNGIYLIRITTGMEVYVGRVNVVR